MNIRISEVKIQKSDSSQIAQVTHRKVRPSTTLNRKYVRQPAREASAEVLVKRSPKVSHFNQQVSERKVEAKQEAMAPARSHPVQVIANNRMKERQMNMAKQQSQGQKMTAQELKEQAIKKALMAASKTEEIEQDNTKVKQKLHFGFGRVVLALSCAAAAVVAIAYFVNLNIPDISLRVAAMQSGLEASYPNYVPRDYSLSSITSESGKVVLSFKKHTDEGKFSLSEEKSSWDSNALLSTYVKPTFKENYSVIKEQGLTIYISDSDAAWVNGGVVYKLKTESGSLSKKQITSIAVSL